MIAFGEINVKKLIVYGAVSFPYEEEVNERRVKDRFEV